MTRISNIWIIFLALSVSELTRWVSGQTSPAQVPVRMVNAKTGVPANFTCESQGVPLSVCLWERVSTDSGSGNLFLSFNAGNTRPGQSAQPGYTYIGDGLEKGQCGVVINNVKDTDNGTWQCTLIANNGATYRGIVNLGILRKPDAPQFNPSTLANMVEDDPKRPGASNQPAKITCYSAKGEPRPAFRWFIDEQPIQDNLGPINETRSQDNQGRDITYTFQDLINYRFTFKDNGKKLRCVLIHDALSDTDRKEVSSEITLKFRPRSAADGRDNVKLPVRAELGEEKIVSLNISANPRPTNVQWTVDGKIIAEGQSSGNYDALTLKEVEIGVWEASLRIKEVEEADLTKKFDLKVQNDLGSADFSINISSSTSGSGGLNAGGVLGIILAIIAVIILVAVIVVFARAKGLLCFKGDDGTASEKERMDGGSTGPGLVIEEKPTLTSRLSAFYENLMKKKDKTAAVDEEAGKDKDTKEKEGGEAVEAVSGDEKDKKPDDIVYAELDLARSGGQELTKPEVRCVDDKTEYAEIVGVAPQVKTVDETSPKKSPKGSPKK